MLFAFAAVIAITPESYGQQKYPVLTNVIAFEELRSRAFVRELEWTNPDGVSEKMKISEMAIPVDQKMMGLIRDFVHFNYGLDSVWLRPRVIVFHAMGDGDLKTSLEVSSFLNDQIPESWGSLYKAGRLPNGAHFIIDKDGTIICLTPPISTVGDRVSYDRDHHHWIIKRHQDGNPVAIGIENVTDRGNLVDLTPLQRDANAKLARWLIWMEKGRIDYVMSHHQFNDEKNYDLFLTAFGLKHLHQEYRTRGRRDIGDKNLGAILTKVRDAGYTTHSFVDLP
jgi:hypothetical protein